MPCVLVFSASDPTCGAGLQADLLALTALGCHPLTAVTALTVQDSEGVESIHPVATDLLKRQALRLLADMPVAAFKTGVLASAAHVAAVAEIIAGYPEIPLVVDPVLASGRGDALSDDAVLSALHAHLLPRASIITPNLPEARRLTGAEDGGECARRLLEAGARFVLVTGTHDDTPRVFNRLYGPAGEIREYAWARLPGSYHGSGCTLASALAAGLARGMTMEAAVLRAQEYTWESLAHAFRPGRGQFIPARFPPSLQPFQQTPNEPGDA